MTTIDSAPFAVIGATGQQGGAIVDALLDAGAPVLAIVRDPDGAPARALLERGVTVRVADQEDRDGLARALDGAAALAFMTTFAGADGTEGEARRGIAVAEAAARAAVPRVVYSSVGGAERATGIPHFESKRRVEERLQELLPAVLLRPTFFMENLAPQLIPGADGEIVLRLPMPGDVPVQMIAVRDVGRAAARLLLDPHAIEEEAVEVAGDEPSLEEAARRLQQATGRPVRFEALPLAVLDGDPDLQAMFAWFARGDAYRADLAATRRLVPGVADLREWAAGRLVGGAAR